MKTEDFFEKTNKTKLFYLTYKGDVVKLWGGKCGWGRKSYLKNSLNKQLDQLGVPKNKRRNMVEAIITHPDVEIVEVG